MKLITGSSLGESKLILAKFEYVTHGCVAQNLGIQYFFLHTPRNINLTREANLRYPL